MNLPRPDAADFRHTEHGDAPTTAATASRDSRWLNALGLLVLAAWLGWWGVSFQRDQLQSDRLWAPLVYHYPSVDFKANYLGARLWLDGHDPYQSLTGHEVFPWYGYPPPMLWFFTWCRWFEFEQARVIWFGVMLAITAAAVWCCCRWRVAVGATPIPFAAALAAVVCTTPLLFAFERGQCDHLVVLLVLGGALLLRSDRSIAEGAAGGLLALAAALKLYPGLLLLALLCMRRWRAVAAFTVVGLVLAALQWDFVLASQQRIQELVGRRGWRVPRELAHSLTASWELIFRGVPGLAWLRNIPGWLAAGAILGPLLTVVSWRLARLPGRQDWALPYFLWLIAVATFVPTVAMDYNLIFLPLALLAVWDCRDPIVVHLLAASCLLWMQPFALPIDARWLLAGKVAALYACGWSLVLRAQESAANRSMPANVHESQHPARPTAVAA